jgi:hypothetical protein
MSIFFNYLQDIIKNFRSNYKKDYPDIQSREHFVKIKNHANKFFL